MKNIVTRFAIVLLAASLVANCAMNQQQSGAVLGGAAGAAVGSTVGKGSGQVVAIVLGALLGSAVGANIGRHMDEQDRMRTAEAMEFNRTGQASSWNNPDTQARYTVTPQRTYGAESGPCREFTMDANVGKKQQQVYGTACRQPDGSWKIVK